MDAIRKQLDVLMGANRNGDVMEVKRKYYDRDVCRLFLAGLCPHDLFQLTVPISNPRLFDVYLLSLSLSLSLSTGIGFTLVLNLRVSDLIL